MLEHPAGVVCARESAKASAMSNNPPFAALTSFLSIPSGDAGAAYCVAGIPFDIGTTNRPGARFGPRALRAASTMLAGEPHPRWWVEPGEMGIADIGDFPIALGDILASYALIEAQAAPINHLIALGGDHGCTLPLLRALAKKRGGPVALVHFDAHIDTWPTSYGQPLGHGQPFFHAINEGLIDPARSIQIGIRATVEREVWDWTLDKGMTILPPDAVHEGGVAAVAEKIRAVVGDAPAYLSFDIDALDPAFAPGTGTPEIGGLTTWQAQAIIRRLGGVNFVGMDLMEVAPAYDHAEITALAGATMVWEYLALQASKLA